MKNLKNLLLLLSFTFFCSSQGMNNDVNTSRKTLMDKIRCENEQAKAQHEKRKAKYLKKRKLKPELTEKRKSALLHYGPAGIILSFASIILYLNNDISDSPRLKSGVLIFSGTLGSLLIGKAFNDLFSTIQRKSDGTFQIISPFTQIKRKLFTFM